MNLKPYKNSHHTVTLYGYLFFLVTSNSRKGLLHFVDLEGFEHWKSVCSCEAWKYGERPCRHICACFEAIAHWAAVRQEIREEWVERLTFLLSMGHSFLEALESDSLRELCRTPAPKPTVRQYTLNPSRKYEARTTASRH